MVHNADVAMLGCKTNRRFSMFPGRSSYRSRQPGWLGAVAEDPAVLDVTLVEGLAAFAAVR